MDFTGIAKVVIAEAFYRMPHSIFITAERNEYCINNFEYFGEKVYEYIVLDYRDKPQIKEIAKEYLNN